MHVDEHKYTSDREIEIIKDVSSVSLSLSQNIGAPCSPTVKPGDYVKIGDVIGEISDSALGCPVHSSISGTVISINDFRNTFGIIEKTVTIESDGKCELSDKVKPFGKSINDASQDEIISFIRNAGITGMGGAAFPTYAKISSAIGKADLLIVNCAECEPFITADHRLLLERPDDIVNGVKILLKASGAKEAFIAVEDNKKNTLARLKQLTEEIDYISLEIMKTKYPQGDERQLIYALTGKELQPGKLPADAGCIIFNAATCAAVFEAFSTGMPLIRRIVTVSGDCIKTPSNLSVPIGTKAKEIIEYCGGLIKVPEKVIFGGPMMGQAQWDPAVCIKKGTSSILLLSSDFSQKSTTPSVCIRCGKCIKNCPMHLMPAYIAQFTLKDDFDNAEKYGAMSCVECGTCSYNCPGKVEIVQYIRVAKNAIRTKKAQMKK